jgi:hypothetical protein
LQIQRFTRTILLIAEALTFAARSFILANTEAVFVTDILIFVAHTKSIIFTFCCYYLGEVILGRFVVRARHVFLHLDWILVIFYLVIRNCCFAFMVALTRLFYLP